MIILMVLHKRPRPAHGSQILSEVVTVKIVLIIIPIVVILVVVILGVLTAITGEVSVSVALKLLLF